MKTTMQDIRNTWPNPVTLDDKDKNTDSYCVGGAACRFVPTVNRESRHFPLTIELADSLHNNLNPNLTYEQALKYSSQIINTSDSGNFDLAWDLLDEALKETKNT